MLKRFQFRAIDEAIEKKVVKGDPLTASEARYLFDRILKREATIEFLRFQLRCAIADLRGSGIYKEAANVLWDRDDLQRRAKAVASKALEGK